MFRKTPVNFMTIKTLFAVMAVLLNGGIGEDESEQESFEILLRAAGAEPLLQHFYLWMAVFRCNGRFRKGQS
jgi:hypothetical protein